MPDLHVLTRIYLPRPLEPETVQQLMLRLMGSDVPRPFNLDVVAGPDGVSYVLGCRARAVQALKRLIQAHTPEARFEAAVRARVATVGRITARPGGLPLAAIPAEDVATAIYAALASRRRDETVTLQVVLGRGQRPQQLPPKAADPHQRVPSKLLDGILPAARDVHRTLAGHVSQPRLNVTLRVGVAAESGKRRRALMWNLFGALQQLESPGVHFDLAQESPARWERAASFTSGFELTATELVAVLGWPVGDRDYLGILGLHPRLLPVPEIVSSTDAVFAVGTAPGPERLVGLDPASRLMHFLALGPTGSGKSTLLERLIHADIQAGRACVVIEPKKQLVDRILQTTPKEYAERIVVLDATDLHAPVGFNPLDVGDRDPDVVVDGILAALAAVFEDGWGPRTEYLIHAGLLSLARAGQARTDPYTLIDLPRLFTDAAFRRPVIAAVQDDVTLAAFWAEFEAMRPGQRAAMLAAPLNKLRKIVMRKHLVAVLGQARPRFRLRDVFRDRKTVLVPLNDALLGEGAAKLLGSLIVSELFLAAVERAAERHPMKHPGMVFIDEVQNYLHLPTSVGDAMSVFRSYGVGLHVAHQYRAQLPPEMRTAFDVNARSKVCFALQPNDDRDMAQLAPQLSREDFQGLGKREIYANLVAGDAPAGWFSARTLPPLPNTKAEHFIRATSRELYGGIAPTAASATAPKPPTATVPEAGAPGAQSRRTHQKARRS
ncbi:hypothetical protein GCM10027414_04960 [Humibacter ginsengiterrae]